MGADGRPTPDSNAPHARRPLEGIRVLDLSRVLAGPYCTMYLADMGAVVTKIERLGRGDDTRGYGPPFVEGESCYFMSINRGKRSLAIDMKTAEGLDLLVRLAEQADVLVENFRPGTADKLGLGYDALSAANPALIYASISGFGHEGDPGYAGRPGYDLLAQGLSGIQDLTGTADGPPTRVGVAIGDMVAGIYTLTAIMTALYVREQTGRGQRIDVSLLDALVSLLSYQAGIAMNGDGAAPRRMGNAHPTICPYDTFRAADGYVNIAAGNDALFASLCVAVGRPELARDERFQQNAGRVEHRESLYAILVPLVRERPVAAWSDLLAEHGIPGGPILSVPEALAHPQVVARKMVTTVTHPKTGQIKVTGFPFHMSSSQSGPKAPPPTLGEHADAILGEELGLSPDEIASLRERGVIS